MKKFSAWVALSTIYAICALFALGVFMSNREQPASTVYDAARSYTAEIPFEMPDVEADRAKWSLLRDVIVCESAARWEVVDVPGRGMDVGPCQVNSYYHAFPAAQSGYDLFIPSQNMLYCIELFEKYYPAMQSGAWNPWMNTAECWQERQRIRKEQGGS